MAARSGRRDAAARAVHAHGLVLALGIAVALGHCVFGVSMALGAFLAGLVVGRSDSAFGATEALPMRDAFAVLFFVSVGMLLDPALLDQQPPLSWYAGGDPHRQAARRACVDPAAAASAARGAHGVPVALAQIGEFSFILATLGRELRLLPAEATNVVVGLSTSCRSSFNPMAARLVPRRRTAADEVDVAVQITRPGMRTNGASHRSWLKTAAVVVVTGPTGQIVSRACSVRTGSRRPSSRLNIDAVRDLRRQKRVGRLRRRPVPETLISAGIRHAADLI